MKIDRRICFTFWCVVWASSLIGVADESVVLEVHDHGGVGSVGWPVTGGVPFAHGELTDPTRLQLLDSNGVPMRLQSDPLARWEDGSIRWLLVNFFADVAAQQTVRYTLRTGARGRLSEGPGAARLLWEQTADGLKIDTGPLRAVVGRQLLRHVSVRNGSDKWVDLIDEPGEMWVTVDGKRQGHYLVSREPGAEVLVEEEGPSRLCVRISGRHRDESGQRYSPFVLRVHAYAGKPYLRVFQTWEKNWCVSLGGTAITFATATTNGIYTTPIRPAGSPGGSRGTTSYSHCRERGTSVSAKVS